MEAWLSIPPILKRKFLLTLFAGIAAAVISIVIFLAADDRILLILGAFLLLCCTLRSRAIWKLIALKNYETTEGVCIGITSPAFRRYRRIHLMDGNGDEFTLLLDRNARFRIGMPYRFYFQKNTRPLMGNAYLDASLSASAFLGYEELPAPNSTESGMEQK